jgi:hypothetical protein
MVSLKPRTITTAQTGRLVFDSLQLVMKLFDFGLQLFLGLGELSYMSTLGLKFSLCSALLDKLFEQIVKK